MPSVCEANANAKLTSPSSEKAGHPHRTVTLKVPRPKGRRSVNWLKIKARLRQEFVIGGFSAGKGSRAKNFGALLLGAYTNGKLRYYGHSGSGFSERELREMMETLNPLYLSECPFVNPPRIAEKIQWVKPRLVCQVSFAEWTDGGEMRQTTFLGLREDKSPEEVVLLHPRS